VSEPQLCLKESQVRPFFSCYDQGKDASNLAIPFYLALYMDSLGGNSELRDQLLDEVLDMDREGSEFLWYTARNRLSFSPSSNSPALSRPPHEVQRTLKGRL